MHLQVVRVYNKKSSRSGTGFFVSKDNTKSINFLLIYAG